MRLRGGSGHWKNANYILGQDRMRGHRAHGSDQLAVGEYLVVDRERRHVEREGAAAGGDEKLGPVPEGAADNGQSLLGPALIRAHESPGRIVETWSRPPLFPVRVVTGMKAPKAVEGNESQWIVIEAESLRRKAGTSGDRKQEGDEGNSLHAVITSSFCTRAKVRTVMSSSCPQLWAA